MSILGGDLEVTMFEDQETLANPAAEFGLGIALSTGKLADAAYHVERFASSRVVSMLRSLPGTADPGSPGWGGEIVGAGNLQQGLFNSLGSFAFGRLLPAMRAVPQRTRLVASTGISGDTPGEGAPKQVSSLALADGMVATHKAAATIVISAEMARSPFAVAFLNTELRNGVGLATDQAFVPAISADAPSTPASGTDGEALRSDLGIALAVLGLGGASRAFILMSPARALAISLMSNPSGGFEFPDMAANGGHIAGTPVVTTDALSDTIVVVDAAGLAADPGELLFSAATHASVALDGGAEATLSLWQHNLVGLRCERIFGAERARPNAVATITGAAYGSAGDTSP